MTARFSFQIVKRRGTHLFRWNCECSAILVEPDCSVYPPCTSVRRFCCFSPFYQFLESVTYVLSVHSRGSNPTRASNICLLFSFS